MPKKKTRNLLTLAEVAERLQFHPKTIYLWARQGHIPAMRVGRAWRVDPGKLQEWIDSRTDGVPVIAEDGVE